MFNLSSLNPANHIWLFSFVRRKGKDLFVRTLLECSEYANGGDRRFASLFCEEDTEPLFANVEWVRIEFASRCCRIRGAYLFVCWSWESIDLLRAWRATTCTSRPVATLMPDINWDNKVTPESYGEDFNYKKWECNSMQWKSEKQIWINLQPTG